METNCSRNYCKILKDKEYDSECKKDSCANCDHFCRPFGLAIWYPVVFVSRQWPAVCRIILQNFMLLRGIEKAEDHCLSSSNRRMSRRLLRHDPGEPSTFLSRAQTRLGPPFAANNLCLQYANTPCDRRVSFRCSTTKKTAICRHIRQTHGNHDRRDLYSAIGNEVKPATSRSSDEKEG